MRTLSTARRTTMIAGAAVLALALAACGDDDDGGASTQETPAASADSELAALVPDEFKEDGKLLIGVDASYAPNEYLDTDGETVIGWDVELFDAVAAKLGLETEYEAADFDAIIPGVQSGKYEIGVSSFTINAERLEQAEMVSYFNAGTQWATKAGNPADVDPDAACGKKVAVQADTVQHTEDLPVRDEGCTSAGNPAIVIEPYQGQDEATTAVVTGKDDAMLADSPVVAYAVKQTNGELELLGDIYDAAPYGYVLNKGETEFGDAIVAALEALMEDGTYGDILAEWGVEAGGIDNPQVSPAP